MPAAGGRLPDSREAFSREALLPSPWRFAGVMAAVLLFVACNVLAERFFDRLDLTGAELYSLTPPTLEVLERLQDPIEVVVFLPGTDPMTGSVRYVLDEYRARSPWLAARFVDPDRDPATFVALQREYGVFEGRTENGRLAAEASIVLVRGERRWFITTDDIVQFDDAGFARPRLEQALSEGLVQLLDQVEATACFSEGHGELSIDDAGPGGLRELRARLERNNFRVRSLRLDVASASSELSACSLLIIAAPEQPFEARVEAELDRYWEQGGGVLVALGPALEGAELGALDRFLQRFGVRSRTGLVFETDEARRLPVGLGGEVFIASALSHPTTRGVEAPDQGVVLRLAQGLELAPGAPATPLLRSSALAFSLPSVAELDGPRAVERLRKASQSPGEQVVAAAAVGEHGSGQRQARLLVLGSVSPLLAATWSEAGLFSTRTFVEQVLTWLSQRRALVSVPDKPRYAAGLALTDAALGEVHRYVLFYMPAVAALIGVLALLRRRHEPESEDV